MIGLDGDRRGAVEEGSFSYLPVSDVISRAWQVSYSDSGIKSGGMTFVLLHGLGANKHYWDDVAVRLVDDARVICVDIPGFGRSKLGKGDYSSSGAALAIQSLLDMLKVGRFVVVGHSLGGLVALQLSGLDQTRATEVVLLDAHLMRVYEILHDLPKFFRYPKVGASLFAVITGALIPWRAPLAGQIARVRLLRAVFFLPMTRRGAGMNPDMLRRAFASSTNRTIIRALFDAKHTNLENLAKNISLPIKLIYGERDNLLAAADLEAILKIFSVNEIFEIKDCGHWPMFEFPDKLASLLLG